MSHNVSTSYHPEPNDWLRVGQLTQARRVASSPGTLTTITRMKELPSLEVGQLINEFRKKKGSKKGLSQPGKKHREKKR